MSNIYVTAEMWMALVKRVQVLEGASLQNKTYGPLPDTPETTQEETNRVLEELRDKWDEVSEACKEKEVPPTDFSASVLISGESVPEDGSHREINPATGQQKDYVVLSAEERSRGFVRPYRDAYRHLKCGKITTMGRAIAETYAREPSFYSGTFCTTCSGHFPIGEDGEFVWYEMDGTTGPKVGT